MMRRAMAVGFVAFVSGSSQAYAASCIPLPSSTNVVPPGKSVASELSAFSGKWEGTWDNVIAHLLVVEQINPPQAIVIYAWGEAPSRGIDEADFVRVKGRVEAGTLTLTLNRPATATYRMRSDGTLDATYEWRGGSSRATMKRVEQDSNPALTAATAECQERAKAPIPKLPSHFKGLWTMNFNQYGNTTELEITSQDDDGEITGFYTRSFGAYATHPDNMCYVADRLPMTGRYNGKKIVLSTQGSRNGRGCQDYASTLFRGKDHYFDYRSNDGNTSRYFDPVD